MFSGMGGDVSFHFFFQLVKACEHSRWVPGHPSCGQVLMGMPTQTKLIQLTAKWLSGIQ